MTFYKDENSKSWTIRNTNEEFTINYQFTDMSSLDSRLVNVHQIMHYERFCIITNNKAQKNI